MDNKDIINCPACDKAMTKIYVKDAGINVDICLDGCGGMLFDNRELEKFDDKQENIDEISKAIEGKTFEKVNTDEIRICPICKVPMVKMGSGRVNVQIDVCNTCGAKFLDNGELQKIRKNKDEDIHKAEALMMDLYQEDINKIHNNSSKMFIPGYKKRREFFEQIIFNSLLK